MTSEYASISNCLQLGGRCRGQSLVKKIWVSKIKCKPREDSLHWYFRKIRFFSLKFQLCDIILPDIGKDTLLFFASVPQMASSFLAPFANLMPVHAVPACGCYWRTTNMQETGMQEHWKVIEPLYKHESKKKSEKEGTNHFSSHFIFTLQKCDCWQGGGQEESKWDECVCKSNDSKTSLNKHKKAV